MDPQHDIVDCVFCINDGFSQHLAVTISSLLLNSKNKNFRLHVVHSGLSDENRSRLIDTASAGATATLNFYYFDPEPYAHLRLGGHIRLETYFRLFLADVLPNDLAKVLYLDADVVVAGDLSELWDYDFGEEMIIGVMDPFSQSSVERLGLPSEHRYVNAGVLLINLQRWRLCDVTTAFERFVEDKHYLLKFHDQDALNVAFCGMIGVVGPQWNFQARTRFKDLQRIGFTRSDHRRIIRDIRIIHFTTNRKPWNYRDVVPFENEYLRYIRETPWRDFVQNDKSFRNWLFRIIDPPVLKMRWGIKKALANLRARG